VSSAIFVRDIGLDLHAALERARSIEAELGDLGDEMFGLDVLRAATEMDGTEILEVPS
jgi:hypothetical protein